MCTYTFCRSLLIILILVIHYLESLVTSSGLHFENFLRSLVLEAPVVGSIFLESFTHAMLALRLHTYWILLLFNDIKTDHVFLCKYHLIISCIVEKIQCSCNSVVFFYYVSYAGIFVSPVSRILYSLIIALQWIFPTTYAIFLFNPSRG